MISNSAQEGLPRAKEALEAHAADVATQLDLLRASLESTADGILVTDNDERITISNVRFRQMWDLGEEPIERSPHRKIAERMSTKVADPQQFLVRMDEIRASNVSELADVLLLTDGRTLERYSRMQFLEGRAVGRVWSFRDVTRRVRAEQALQQLNENLERRVAQRTAELIESEQHFQQLVRGVTDYAIYMLSPTGTIVSWNPGAERIKGYSEAEIIGKNFAQFYTPEDRANGRPQVSLDTAAKFGKFEGEGWRVRKNGTRFWANVLIDALHDKEGRLVGFAKVTRDLTEHRAMQEQLHQAQKMEAIGQLTGGVAHDFNNLLTVIIGNLETIWRQVPADNSRLRRAVDQASRGAQRAATLTQQLLAFARRQPLNPTPTDVNRLVADMSELLRRTLDERIAIETVLGGGLWRIEVDPHQLESALLNLAVNSRDAMPEGGRLTIETANAHLDENYAAGYAEISAGQYVVICVSDTGTGMAPDVMARAFEPFFTTKAIGHGTGLGLSQVYGFVKQSGGHVKLYSEPSQGTTVKIYLPRPVQLTEEGPQRPVIVPHGHPNETILVVEDDNDVRSYSTESLRELGFTVLEACDPQQALHLIEQHPEINLLFTDVGLPGMNGRQLVDEIRKRRSDLRVLFTTGYARNAIVHQGRLDPGIELLTKPFTRAQLANRVRDVLDARG